jgi:hypothetical protein
MPGPNRLLILLLLAIAGVMLGGANAADAPLPLTNPPPPPPAAVPPPAPPTPPPIPPRIGDPSMPPGHFEPPIRFHPARAVLSPAAAKKLIQQNKELLPTLIWALGDADEQVRKLASDVLALLGKESLPEVTKALQDKSPLVRSSAAEALGRMGASAREALPDLVKAIKDDDASVRKSALKAFHQIAGQIEQEELPTFPARPLPGGGPPGSVPDDLPLPLLPPPGAPLPAKPRLLPLND